MLATGWPRVTSDTRRNATNIQIATSGTWEPIVVWRVNIEPNGFYEIEWDEFAIRGDSGWYLLHLGFSD
jgi:hypothetical protein